MECVAFFAFAIDEARIKKDECDSAEAQACVCERVCGCVCMCICVFLSIPLHTRMCVLVCVSVCVCATASCVLEPAVLSTTDALVCV